MNILRIITATIAAGAIQSYGVAEQTGIASWYSTEAGLITASGQKLNPAAMTAASWFYPFGTQLCVSYGGRSVIVTVNDRGPAKRLVLSQNRIVDLTAGAFSKLAPLKTGLIRVTISEILPRRGDWSIHHRQKNNRKRVGFQYPTQNHSSSLVFSQDGKYRNNTVTRTNSLRSPSVSPLCGGVIAGNCLALAGVHSNSY